MDARDHGWEFRIVRLAQGELLIHLEPLEAIPLIFIRHAGIHRDQTQRHTYGDSFRMRLIVIARGVQCYEILLGWFLFPITLPNEDLPAWASSTHQALQGWAKTTSDMARTQTNRQVKRSRLRLKQRGVALAQFEFVGRDTSSSLVARILHVGCIQFEPQRFHLIAF